MAIPVCVPDTLSCYFQNVDDCCYQFPSTSITLNRVYESQVYWNSTANELNCLGCTTNTWTYQQLHFFCERDGNDEQVYRLTMCMGYATNTRLFEPCLGAGVPPPTEYTFDLVSFSCDPLSVVFRIVGEDFPPCCDRPYPGPCLDPGDPIPSCTVYATITA